MFIVKCNSNWWFFNFAFSTMKRCLLIQSPAQSNKDEVKKSDQELELHRFTYATHGSLFKRSTEQHHRQP